MLSVSNYIKCQECGKTSFQEMQITKLLIGASRAVRAAPLHEPVTPMYKEETEIMYKCVACGYVMSKDDIGDQKYD